MNHVSSLKYRFLPAWLPYQCESCWNFSWGPKLSHFFHIFTHEYVTLHLWVCTFSLAGMSPFTRGYATFHSRVCHRSLAGMPLFTRGYVTLHSLVDHVSLASMSPFTRGYATFHWRVCHLSFAGIPLFTRRCVPFYSWVCHFSLLSLSPFTRGFVTFHSRVLYLPLAAMSPFARGFATTHLWACHLSTVQPRICPNITAISSFAIKHSFLWSRSLLFSFTHVNNVFSHILAWRTWRRSRAPQTATWRLRVALLAYGIQSSNATKLGIHQMGRVWEAGHNHERILPLDESIKKW